MSQSQSEANFLASGPGRDPRSTNKPRLGPNDPEKIFKQFTNLEIKTIQNLASYDDMNCLILAENGAQYVLKIHNAADTKENLDLQNKCIQHLRNHDILCPSVVSSVSGLEILQITTEQGQNLYVRLLDYVPGRVLAETELTLDLCRKLGHLLGKVDKALLTFEHPTAHREMAWDLANAKKVILAHLPVVKEPECISLINHFISLYEVHAEPFLRTARKSVIHADPNDHNIIITEAPTVEVTGIVDFGDVVYSHTINEISVAIAYAILGKENAIQIARELLLGYKEEFFIEEKEIEIIFLLSCMRLCTSAVMGTYNIQIQPENREYLEVHSKPAWEMLKKLQYTDFRSVFAGI